MANKFNPADPATSQQVFNPLQKEVIGAINLVDESTKNIATYENEDLGENGKAYNIEYSAGYDNQHPMMEDYIPESMTRVYPYRAIKGEAKDFILQPNQITIIRVTQSQVNDFKNLKTDDNGNVYFEILAAIDNTTKVALSSKPEEMVRTIRKLKTFTAVTTNYYDTRDDLPDFFTIDKPLDMKEYKDGKQIVYYGSTFTPAYPEDIQELADENLIEDESRLAEIVLSDISQLEEQFSKAKIFITLDANTLQNPMITFRNVDGNLVTKPGIRLKTNAFSLLNNVRAKGELSMFDKWDEQNKIWVTPDQNMIVDNADIDFNANGYYAPIKMSPDKVDANKILLASDWFDYTMTMPYFAASTFDVIGGASIQDLLLGSSIHNYGQNDFVGKTDFAGGSEYTLPFTDKEINWDPTHKVVLTKDDVNKLQLQFNNTTQSYKYNGIGSASVVPTSAFVHNRNLSYIWVHFTFTNNNIRIVEASNGRLDTDSDTMGGQYIELFAATDIKGAPRTENEWIKLSNGEKIHISLTSHQGVVNGMPNVIIDNFDVITSLGYLSWDEINKQDARNIVYNPDLRSDWNDLHSSFFKFDTLDFSDYNLEYINEQGRYEIRNKSTSNNETNEMKMKLVDNESIYSTFKLSDVWFKVDDNGNGQIHFRINSLNEDKTIWHSPSGWKILFSGSEKSKVLDDEDIKLIEDMILISSGFKDSWAKAPRNNSDSTKIEPTYRVGHKGILISSIADKKPADVIDGLVYQHENKWPKFRTDKERYLAFKFIVNALSKYIISNVFTTNGGGNELNAITLPWFLLNFDEINYWGNPQWVPVDDMALNPVGSKPEGTTDDNKFRQSYLLHGVNYSNPKDRPTTDKTYGVWLNHSDIKFKTYSSYFREDFTKVDKYYFDKGINLPKNINISSIKIAESDRKVILPDLKESINENNKINIPGQNNGSEDYLSNLFFIPVSNNKDIERLFLNGKDATSNFKKGDTIKFKMNIGEPGKVITKDDVLKEIYRKFGKENIAPILDSQINFSRTFSFNERVWPSSKTSKTSLQRDFDSRSWFDPFPWFDWVNLFDSIPWHNVKNETIIDTYTKSFGYDKSMVEIHTNDAAVQKYRRFELFYWSKHTDERGSALLDVYHNEVQDITITFINDTIVDKSNPRLIDRQVYFDKIEWLKFINANLTGVNDMFTFYLVSEDDTKINFIDEIILSLVWGDEIKVFYDGAPYELEFELPSKTDETIGIQRITIV